MTLTLKSLPRRFFLFLYHLALFVVSYLVVLFGTYSSASSFCENFCVSSFLLDGSAMLPSLESNNFMKKASCGAHKLKTLSYLVPGSLFQWNPFAVAGLLVGLPFCLSAFSGFSQPTTVGSLPQLAFCE